MAFNAFTLFFLVVALAVTNMVQGSDPDIISDFVVPTSKVLSSEFFTYTGIRGIFEVDTPPTFRVTKTSMVEFPALNGQSVSFAVLQFPVGGVSPPHTHPHASELLFVIEGCLEVGFVDTANKFYNQTLQIGDMFIFPKGLVHYQYNSNPKKPTTAVSAFGSANAGTVSVPSSVFASGVSDFILAKAFKTDVATIQKIKAGLAPWT